MATVPLATYILKRIQQLGISTIQGVPGDMNLTFLDYIEESPDFTWVGNANELNAAYSADGYARVKGAPGVLVTTYGVGELSALNGIAGAYAETLPIIHIVGNTSLFQQNNRMTIHHCIGPSPDHGVYRGMSEPVRVASVFLDDPEIAPKEIDRCITACILKSKPVYLFLPTDMVAEPVDASRLETPLDFTPPSDSSVEKEVIGQILEAIYTSKNPVLLADVITARFHCTPEVRKLVDITQFPSFDTNLGKGIINETHPTFAGTYNGVVSFPGVAESIESSDFVINVGPLISDSNTGGFTRSIKDQNVVLINPDHVILKGKTYSNTDVPVLTGLLQNIDKTKLPKVPKPKLPPIPPAKDSDSENIVQSYIWTRLGSFLQPGDIVLAESGTAQFGMPDAMFPSDVTYITQQFYSSIGYCVGSCLGALLALQEKKKGSKVAYMQDGGIHNRGEGRVILLVGDGSLQMTVQEIGTMIKCGLTPIIFVINNDGYSIERAIWGPQREYNDICKSWNYQLLLPFMGSGAPQKNYTATTKAEFEKLLTDETFNKADVIQLAEVFMDKYDYPWRLSTQVDIIMEGNRKRALARQKELKERQNGRVKT